MGGGRAAVVGQRAKQRIDIQQVAHPCVDVVERLLRHIRGIADQRMIDGQGVAAWSQVGAAARGRVSGNDRIANVDRVVVVP